MTLLGNGYHNFDRILIPFRDMYPQEIIKYSACKEELSVPYNRLRKDEFGVVSLKTINFDLNAHFSSFRVIMVQAFSTSLNKVIKNLT